MRLGAAVLALILTAIVVSSERGHYSTFLLVTGQGARDVCIKGRGGDCLNVKDAIATSWGYWIFVGYWLCEVALFILFGLLAIGGWAVASGLFNTRTVYNLDEYGISKPLLWKTEILSWDDIESVNIEGRRIGRESREILHCYRKNQGAATRLSGWEETVATKRGPKGDLRIVPSIYGITAADLIEIMRRFKPDLRVNVVSQVSAHAPSS